MINVQADLRKSYQQKHGDATYCTLVATFFPIVHTTFVSMGFSYITHDGDCI